MLYVFVFSIFIIFSIVAFICEREIIESKRNPIPKFENGDKRFKDVKMYKTRKIGSALSNNE